MIDHGQFAVPGTTRSRLILEVASELVGGDDWLQKQAKVSLRTQGTADWPLITREDAPDDLIMAFCRALEARKDRIPWRGEGLLPLERMCRDTPETPLDIPLHPAAERFWRDCGYLT